MSQGDNDFNAFDVKNFYQQSSISTDIECITIFDKQKSVKITEQNNKLLI